MLVRGVDYIGMPNILAGRQIVPELMQGEVNERESGARGRAHAGRDGSAAKPWPRLRALRARLGAPGAAARVAEMALAMRSSRHESA